MYKLTREFLALFVKADAMPRSISVTALYKADCGDQRIRTLTAVCVLVNLSTRHIIQKDKKESHWFCAFQKSLREEYVSACAENYQVIAAIKSDLKANGQTSSSMDISPKMRRICTSAYSTYTDFLEMKQQRFRLQKQIRIEAALQKSTDVATNSQKGKGAQKKGEERQGVVSSQMKNYTIPKLSKTTSSNDRS
ncbi:hypothetical protein PoB_004598100 [Plakobranchus ocellatus]|uniref:Uncharacterized protein n=1 Tax=Plakobranchus ocellatus TaxID=259542 RepID=A0AAV4BGB1_9GAST|nr:hypothetical protein PoB_004598100 [Plakobranchus ocellatus]